MEESSRQYQLGMAEDILRECEAEPTEPDRQTEMEGGILLTSGIHVYLPRYGINVHEWLDGQCTLKQLEQEPCEVKGTREEVLHGKGIQTGGSGRNPCGDGTACRSARRLSGKR